MFAISIKFFKEIVEMKGFSWVMVPCYSLEYDPLLHLQHPFSLNQYVGRWVFADNLPFLGSPRFRVDGI